MTKTDIKTYPQRWYDSLRGYFFRAASSGLLPSSWFRAPLPPLENRKPSPAFPSLEIVSHCWQYSHMLIYQLCSLINHPPTKLSVTMTVFYAPEDSDTEAVLNFIAQHQLPNVTWNWQPLPPEHLFRRGIGRNSAALSTQADWVWMTDCDIIFYQGCLDSLAEGLLNRKDTLVFPRQEKTTTMLGDDSSLLQKGRTLQLVDIDPENFSLQARDRAKGAYQIIHGDVARAIGYCANLSLYQTPAKTWCKCYEDRAFRWLVGTQGIPVDIANVYQIRHITKGRYQQGSITGKLRSKIRRMQE